MAPTSTRFLALAAALTVIGCFNSDELAGATGTTTTGGTDTVTMYSDESTDENDDSWTAEETGPAETTCRDAIDCLVSCYAAAVLNMDPEPNFMCFYECDMGLTKEEAYKLIELSECIGLKCTAEGSCGGEATDTDCLTCIAANANDPEPPGCEEQAANCD
jgi:hypothetical protein